MFHTALQGLGEMNPDCCFSYSCSAKSLGDDYKFVNLSFNGVFSVHGNSRKESIFNVLSFHNVTQTITDKTKVVFSMEVLDYYNDPYGDVMVYIGFVPLVYLQNSSPFSRGYEFQETPYSDIAPTKCVGTTNAVKVVVKEKKVFKIDVTNAFKLAKVSKNFGIQLILNEDNGYIVRSVQISHNSILLDISIYFIDGVIHRY